MYNKNIFRKTNDKKLLHKVGKQWVTVSIAMLMLIGGGAVVSHTTHAATNAPKATSVANQPAQKANNQPKQVSSSAIQSSASNLHQALLNNSVKSNVKPSNNAPIHQTAKPNFAYANYLKQMGGQNAYNNLMNNEAKSANNNKQINRSINNKQLGSDDNPVKTGVYDGLNYRYDTIKQAIKFVSGTLNKSDLSDFLETSDFNYSDAILDQAHGNSPIKSVIFSDTIQTNTINNKLNNMNDMFANDSNLQSVTFGNNFDTSRVSSMDNMFSSDQSIQTINFGKSFNTKNVTPSNMENLFGGISQAYKDSDLTNISIASSDTKFNNTADFPHTFYAQDINNPGYYHINDFSKGNVGSFSSFPTNANIRGTYNNGSNINVDYIYHTNNQSIEFYKGSLKSDTSNFLDGLHTTLPIKNVTFDGNINTTKLSDMSNMLSHNEFDTVDPTASLQSVTFGNGFNTSTVKNMSNMFSDDTALQSIIFGNSFDTTKALNNKETNGISDLFGGTNPNSDDINHNLQYITINSPRAKFNSSADFPHNFYGKNGSNYQISDLSKGTIGKFCTVPRVPLNATVMGTYDGLNYIYTPGNQSIEFTNGTFNKSNLSDFMDNSDLGTNITYGKDTEFTSPIKSIKFDNNINTSNITNMNNMFSNCPSLQSVTFSNTLNTNNINTSNMFNGCNHLQNITTNSLNTTFNSSSSLPLMYSQRGTIYKPHDMSQGYIGSSYTINALPSDAITTGLYDGLKYIYHAKNKLLEFVNGNINVSNTSNFLNIPKFGGTLANNGVPSYNMNLKSVKFDSDINISKVNNMSGMFQYDDNLRSLILPESFNTSNVTNMSRMFLDDAELQSLILPESFNTSNVTDMTGMFFGNISLKKLILPNSFNINTSNTNYMFAGDALIQQLTLPNNVSLTKNMLRVGSGSTSDIWTQVDMAHGNNNANIARYNLANYIINTPIAINYMLMYDGSQSYNPYVNIDPYASYQRLTNLSDNYVVDPLSWSYAKNHISMAEQILSSSLPSDLKSYFSTKYISEYPVSNITFYRKDNSDKYTSSSTPTDILNIFDGNSHPGTWLRSPNPKPQSDIATINYQVNGNTIKSVVTSKQKFNTNININNQMPNPNEYSLINPKQTTVLANGNTYNIPIYIDYQKEIDSLATKASDEAKIIKSYQDSSASISNADNWVHSNSSSATSADKWTSNNGSTVSNEAKSASTSADTNTQNINTNSANASTSASNAQSNAESYASSSTNSLSTSTNNNFNNATKSISSVSSNASISAHDAQSNAVSSAESYTNNSINSLSTSTNTNFNNATKSINSASFSASISANNAQTNAENYASNSINTNTNAINNNINSVSNSTNDNFDIAANGINGTNMNLANLVNNTTTLSNSVNNNINTLSSSANNNFDVAANGINNTNMNLANDTTSLSTSANSGIQSNSISISTLSASASSELTAASNTINQNTKDIKALSNKTNHGLKNVQGQITTNKTNADTALNNLQKDLKHPTTHTNNAQLNKDINVINQALGNKEDKTNFGKTVSDIHNLINTKADNAKIMNDEKQLQNAINAKPNNTGATTTVHTVETTGTNDAEVKADKNALQNEISTKADRAKVQIELRKLQKDLKNRPTYHKHFAGKSFYILVKKPILIHKATKAIGSKKDSVGIIKPSQHTLVHVLGKKDGHYVIKYLGHYYFITANHKYVKNAYYQKNDLKKTNYIKVIKPAGEYSNANYTKYNQSGHVTTWNVGTVIPISHVQILGNNDVTRFQLVNGHYITANKLFVKLI